VDLIQLPGIDEEIENLAAYLVFKILMCGRKRWGAQNNIQDYILMGCQKV